MRNSVLVVVLAETRAHEHTFALFRSNLLDVLHADLALCVAENEREDTANPFYQYARHIWTYQEPQDWGDAFDEAQAITGNAGNWRQLLGIRDQWLGGIQGDNAQPGAAGILLFFRWFLKESLVKSNVLDRYDRFVITRSDFMHKVPHLPLTFLDPSYVWIPDGEDYGGFTDRHVVVHRDDVIPALSIADEVIADPDGLYESLVHLKEWNLERYVKFSFTRLGLTPRVKRYPYTMYTVRSVGGHTRWAKGQNVPQLGYHVKYK